jgi:hypothetical protein
MEHKNTLEIYETRGFCPGRKGNFVKPCKNMKRIISTHGEDFVQVCKVDFVQRGLCLYKSPLSVIKLRYLHAWTKSSVTLIFEEGTWFLNAKKCCYKIDICAKLFQNPSMHDKVSLDMIVVSLGTDGHGF